MASPSSDSSGAVCEWEKFEDDDTKTPYYYNKRTGESSWDVPEGFVEKEAEEKAHADAPKLPPTWRKFVDESAGKAYYYDEANEVTQWEEPEGFVGKASDDDSGEENTDEDSEDEERAPVREPSLVEEPEITQPDDEKPSSSINDKPEEQAAAADSAVPVEANTLAEGEAATKPVVVQSNWVKHMDRASGNPYYHDTVSGKTQWEEPAGFVDAPPMLAVTAEYQAHLNRVRTERLTRVTQQVLDPTGSLGRLNAILDGINPSGGAVTATPAEAMEGGEEDGEASTVALPATAGGIPRAEWQQHVDPHTQRFYYHNVVTGETQWQKPDAPVVSGLADWVPPEVADPAQDAANRKTVSGVNYAAKAKFNRITGKYEQFGGDEYWQTQGVAADRAGRQMSHFFNMTDLEKNREEAKVLKEKLKRKNIDWKKVAAEKKAKKLKQKNEWMYQD